ncbi:MAG TPA: thiosulfate oxidation carrier protein SoxY [Burkholderiales bacterium]|nr:thiosulfate oxidation carrier protein SoxY [Burkholderiales bacterium]
MNRNRRVALKSAGLSSMLVAGFATGLLRPADALAIEWNQDAFHAKNVADALQKLGAQNPVDSGDITIKAPDIAENGAVVPIDITSDIPGTERITVLIDKNPFPYVGSFDFTKGALPYVHVRVKMGESSNVRVIATANGKHYQAVKEVKVTIGGCGG